MASYSLAGTIVEQRRAHGSGWTNYSKTDIAYAGSNKSSKEYNVALIKFTTPKFSSGTVSDRAVFSLWVTKGATDSAALRYAICTSDLSRGRYVNTYSEVTDDYQITSGKITLANIQPAGGAATYKQIAVETAALQSETTYYLYLWAANDVNNGQHIVLQGANYHQGVTVDCYDPYKLTINAGRGSTITVDRISSPSNLIGALVSGDTLYDGDVLQIAYGIASGGGYALASHTLNGEMFISGETHTVSGNVVVVSTTSVSSVADVSATDAPQGGTSIITLSNTNPACTYTLEYESNDGVSGIIIENTVQESVQWSVPSTLSTGSYTIRCYTYSGASLVGSDSCQMNISSGSASAGPTITTAFVQDNRHETCEATGNKYVIVKNASTVRCFMTVTPEDGTTIVKRMVNGVEFDSNGGVTFENCEYDSFTFYAEDSNGASATKVVTPVIVDAPVLSYDESYTKAFRPQPTTGEVVVKFSGYSFNGSYGQSDGVTLISHRIKESTESVYSGEWISIPESKILATDTQYLSYGSVPVEGEYDYTKEFDIQLRIQQGYIKYNSDGSVNDAESGIIDTLTVDLVVPAATPVFDWGKDDFNFNVPVHFKSDIYVEGKISSNGVSQGGILSYSVKERANDITFTLNMKDGSTHTHVLNFGDDGYPAGITIDGTPISGIWEVEADG